MNPVVIGIMALLSIYLGYKTSKFAHDFAQRWTITILASWVGVALILLSFKMVGITNGIINLIGATTGCICGALFGKKVNKQLRVILTAIIGAFVTLIGISEFCGGYPDESDAESEKKKVIWLYFFGLCFLTFAGYKIQMKFLKLEDTEKDDGYQM